MSRFVGSWRSSTRVTFPTTLEVMNDIPFAREGFETDPMELSEELAG